MKKQYHLLLPVTDVGFVWVWWFFIALTEAKVGWGDDSKGLSSVPLDLKMQQSKQWECGELEDQRNP